MKPDGSSYLGEGGRCEKGDADELSLLDLTAGFWFGRRIEPSSSSTNVSPSPRPTCAGPDWPRLPPALGIPSSSSASCRVSSQRSSLSSAVTRSSGMPVAAATADILKIPPGGLKNGDGGGPSATDFLAASVLSAGVAPMGTSGAATRLIDFDRVTSNHASIPTREGGGRIGRSAQSFTRPVSSVSLEARPFSDAASIIARIASRREKGGSSSGLDVGRRNTLPANTNGRAGASAILP